MGWRQRSRNEWQRLVAGWERSGLTRPRLRSGF